MVVIKDSAEIKTMKEGGRRLGSILKLLLQKAKPGVHTADLDKLADKLIEENGAKPSFRIVPNYKWATCMCVNDEVVHGIPDDILSEGDILCIDIGLFYKGFHTDTAWTIQIKKDLPAIALRRQLQAGKLKIKNEREKEIERFLDTGKIALKNAILQAKVGNRVGHISKAIQDTIEGSGYSVVKALVGHGIGKKLHEDPQIPGYLNKEIGLTPKIVEGMILAIEVIYNEGSDKVVYKNNDGWTIVTYDNSWSAVFEHTVAVTNKGVEILTVLD